MTPDRQTRIHATAVVDEDVGIGEGTRIWHYSHIMPGCTIGGDCTIGAYVSIGPNVRIGRGCKIQNSVNVFEGVEFGDDVFCGPGVTFTNVRVPRAGVSRRDRFLATRVEKGASVGANATIVCGVTLGSYCMIGAGAVVTASVPDHAVMTGNPARRAGWACRCGEILDAALICAECGAKYDRTDSSIEPL